MSEVVEQQRAAIAEANGEAWPSASAETPAAATPEHESASGDAAQNDAQSDAHTDNATPVDSGGDEQQQGESASHDDEPPKPGRNSFARKIDKLTREANAARAETEALRRLIQQQPQQSPTQQPNEQQQQRADADPKPAREAFADYGDFLVETAAWNGRQEARRQNMQMLQRLAQHAQATQVREQAQRMESDFRAKVSEGAKEFKDFADVTEQAADVVVPDAMTAAIAQSDNPAAVLYWLAKNPTEVARIGSMHPARVPFEVGKISASVAVKRPAISNAPAPGKPVSARGGATGFRDDMSMDEFVTMRRRSGKKA